MRTFFRARLDGGVPLPVLLVRDMLLVGTLLNLAFLGFAVMALEAGYPDWLALVVFLVPMPYNVFLWFAVWRRSRLPGPGATFARTFATLWLMLMFVV